MHAHQLIARLPAAAQRIAFDAVMRFGLAPRFLVGARRVEREAPHAVGG